MEKFSITSLKQSECFYLVPCSGEVNRAVMRKVPGLCPRVEKDLNYVLCLIVVIYAGMEWTYCI